MPMEDCRSDSRGNEQAALVDAPLRQLELNEMIRTHKTPFPTGTIGDGPDPGIRVAMATFQYQSSVDE
jgi:hypothetical protein